MEKIENLNKKLSDIFKKKMNDREYKRLKLKNKNYLIKNKSNAIKRNVEILSNDNIELTVGLPIYKSKDIAWLALEGLCDQKNINFKWELLICEEIHDDMVGDEFFKKYINRLKKNNCCRVEYIELIDWVNLPKKWKILGEHAHKKSKAFLLHAADCYSFSERLSNTYNKIVDLNYDWYDTTKGYFYSFNSNRIVLYDIESLTNLNMGFSTQFIRNLPESNLNSGIDGFLFKTFEKQKRDFRVYRDKELYSSGLDTHGFNNISKRREEYFDSKPHIFKSTDLDLKDLDIKKTIIDKLKKQHEHLQNTKK